MAMLLLMMAASRLTPDAQQRPAPAFELDEATISSLQDSMAAGRYTSRRLVDLYLERIAALDRTGPTLRAVIELNPDARAIADRLDAERRAGRVRGPLHGIPVLIKDNIDTADSMSTTAGSLALEGSIAARDAFLVTRLRDAGAVILGKTNLSEWANFRSSKSTSGWSGRGGQVKSPYVLDRNPCGSSSGSGTAAAANLATIAVGTETDGSIVCPSGAAALVGIKPTVGLVSRSGIIPISHTQDTAGPMARTVADAAVLLGAMAGVDPRDRATAASAGKAVDYRTALKADGLKGARIGVARKKYFGYSPPADALIAAAIAEMQQQGAVIVDPADIPNSAGLDHCEFEVLLYEFKADLNAYLGKLAPGSKIHSLADLIAFNARESAREMPFFGQETLIASEKKGPLTSPAYRQGAHNLPNAVARWRHRCGHDTAAPRRDRRAHGQSGLDHRPLERRSLPRREFHAGGSRRIPQHHRAGRLHARAARGDYVHRTGVERGQADSVCLRIRAGHSSPQAAAVSRGGADGRRNRGSGFGPGALIRPTAPP